MLYRRMLRDLVVYAADERSEVGGDEGTNEFNNELNNDSGTPEF